METLEFFNEEINKAEARLSALKQLKAEFEKRQKKEQEQH